MKKNNDAFYEWLDKIAAKRAQDWTVAPLKALDDNVVYTEMLNDPTYSYQAFYENNPLAANLMLMADGAAHFDDSGKTMYHPTFSNQSLFSGYLNEYNPLGIEGGGWNNEGTVYTPSPSQLANYFNYQRTRDYLDRAESRPVKIIMPEYEDGKDYQNSKYYRYVDRLGPSLYREMARRKIENIENFYDFAMKQMGSESNFGLSDPATQGFNFGGVKPGTKYTKYDSVNDYTKYWVDMIMRMYPNAPLATTPEEYVNALLKNIEGNPYFEDSADAYLKNIKYAKTLEKYMKLYRKDHPEAFETEPQAPVVQIPAIVEQPDALRVARPSIDEMLLTQKPTLNIPQMNNIR